MKQLFCFLFLISLFSCRKCEEIPTPQDPCLLFKAPNSAFNVYTVQDTGNGEQNILRFDTIGPYPAVFFEATDSTCDVYEWQIGDESKKRYGKKILIRFFDSNSFGTKIIKLKTTKSSICSSSILVDSTHRHIYIRNQDEGRNLYLHKFQGRDLINGIDNIEVEGKFWTEDITSVVDKITPGFGGGVVLFVKFPSCDVPSAILLGSNDIYSSTAQAGGPLACHYTRILDGGDEKPVYLTNNGKRLVIKGLIHNLMNPNDPVKNFQIEAFKK